MKTPAFWSDQYGNSLDAAYASYGELAQLLAANHQLVLHTKDGGWRMPIYVCFNWLGRLSRTYSTLVWRKLPALKAAPDGEQAILERILADTHLWALVTPAQRRISALGDVSLKLSWSEVFDKPILRAWGTVTGEFAWWEHEPGGDPYAVSFYREVTRPQWGDKGETVFRVRERFALQPGGNVQVTNEARYRTESNADDAEPISLKQLFPDDPVPQEDWLAMDCLPAYRVTNGDEAASDYTPDVQNLQRALTTAYTT